MNTYRVQVSDSRGVVLVHDVVLVDFGRGGQLWFSDATGNILAIFASGVWLEANKV
jgi:hypothetical protein